MLNLAGAALTNQSGGLISGTYVNGVSGSGADSVVNFGSIDGGTGLAIYLKNADAGSVTNQAGAQITGYSGVKLRGIGATVTNDGSIASTASGDGGYGVYLRNGGILTNGQSGTGTSTATIQGYDGVVVQVDRYDRRNRHAGELRHHPRHRGAGFRRSAERRRHAGKRPKRSDGRADPGAPIRRRQQRQRQWFGRQLCQHHRHRHPIRRLRHRHPGQRQRHQPAPTR